MIQTSWTAFKDTIHLGFVVKDHDDHYDLLTIDGRATWTCSVPKTEPKNNDQIDFEDNYKLKASTTALQIMNKNPEAIASDNKANTVEVAQTTITTSATLINTPCQAEYLRIKHISTGVTIWIGKDSAITANGSDVYPLAENEIFEVRLGKHNENNFYGIVSSGTAKIYVLGTYKES